MTLFTIINLLFDQTFSKANSYVDTELLSALVSALSTLKISYGKNRIKTFQTGSVNRQTTLALLLTRSYKYIYKYTNFLSVACKKVQQITGNKD